jgi:ATP adenylyltransferase
VAAGKQPTHDESCFICEGLSKDDDRRHLIALRTPLSAVMLNRFPYNNGHLLIAPRAHKGELGALDIQEIVETMDSVRRMIELLNRVMHPDGYNVGLNLGQAAGAGLPGHIHWHLVPRWHGDTNFMPIVSDAKVIVQSLDTLYDLLVSHLRQETSK